MKKMGFTLIEMLVVLSLLSIFGVLILTIFTRSLRGNNKSQIIGVIKQNGQTVLEMMDKLVRESDFVVCPRVNSISKSLVVVKDGQYTRYRFIEPRESGQISNNCSDTDLTKATNGCIVSDNPNKETVGTDSTTGKEYADPAFVNKVCADADILISPTALTDTNSQTGISVLDGSFALNKQTGFKDQVTVKFKLKPGIYASDLVAGQIDAVSFQTTVQLR